MLLVSWWLLFVAECKVAISSAQSNPSRLTGFWWQHHPTRELVCEDLLQKAANCRQDLQNCLGPMVVSQLEGQGQ